MGHLIISASLAELLLMNAGWIIIRSDRRLLHPGPHADRLTTRTTILLSVYYVSGSRALAYPRTQINEVFDHRSRWTISLLFYSAFLLTLAKNSLFETPICPFLWFKFNVLLDYIAHGLATIPVQNGIQSLSHIFTSYKFSTPLESPILHFPSAPQYCKFRTCP